MEKKSKSFTFWWRHHYFLEKIFGTFFFFFFFFLEMIFKHKTKKYIYFLMTWLDKWQQGHFVEKIEIRKNMLKDLTVSLTNDVIIAYWSIDRVALLCSGQFSDLKSSLSARRTEREIDIGKKLRLFLFSSFLLMVLRCCVFRVCYF